ncbi:unnamed protein product [Bemisia tabaci]|uniref:Tyrosine aminotransferase n=1 Tax=Bemisia tabaci TaxID=7038 RepID=A0A9P0F279_BEMTA|nr:unnamed protein product [Bemisia tabaci]
MPDKWSVKPSLIARSTFNPIRDIVDNLKIEPNPSKEFIPLSLGDPTVFGNLGPAQEAVDAVIKSAASYGHNGYTASTGNMKAREAVAQYSSTDEYTVKPEDVIICSGCSGALDLCITALANPGDTILVPRPGFSIYRTQAEGLGIKIRSYNLLPSKGWEIDLINLENQLEKYKCAAIVINNPSNPCGSNYSILHLRDIVNTISRYHVPIIADEIYEHLVFPGEKFHPLASVSADVPILSCSGLTKRFLCPGWRLGWIVIHDRHDIFGKEMRTGLQNLSTRIIGANTIVQGALPDILAKVPEEFFDNVIDTLQKHAKVAYDLLSQTKGIKPVMPQGAMYMMVGVDIDHFPDFSSDLEFVEKMVGEESVFCLPGKCFDYPSYFRIVLTVPEHLLKEACQRIRSFCNKYYDEDKKMNEINMNTYNNINTQTYT